MTNPDVCFPISNGELERRWEAVRKAMKERHIDVLVLQCSNDYQGGYVKWLTDIPAVNGVHAAVVFPADDLMTVIAHGPHAQTTSLAPSSPYRGVGRLVTSPNFAAANYTRHYQSDTVLEELDKRNGQTVGLVGTAMMSGAFLQHILESRHGKNRFEDATDLIDEIKAIKSAEELRFIRDCADMQDKVITAISETVRPGMRCYEVSALAQKIGQDMGSENGLFMATTRPIGQPGPKLPRHLMNAEIKPGDVFDILVENNGPGGFYCEIARMFVFGKATSEMQEGFAFTLEAQRHTLDQLVPGADPAEILAKHNSFMRANGRPEERRLLAHSQGYDLVERPLIFADETIRIQANMNMVVHLGFASNDAFVGICDNYIVGENGVSDCLHRTPQKIFEIIE